MSRVDDSLDPNGPDGTSEKDKKRAKVGLIEGIKQFLGVTIVQKVGKQKRWESNFCPLFYK
jgi:hypothetical protein